MTHRHASIATSLWPKNGEIVHWLIILGISPLSEVAGIVWISLLRFVLSIVSFVFCFHQVFCLPLSPFPGTGAPTNLLSTRPSSILLYTVLHSSLFSVIFLAIDATLIDPLTCSFMMLSFFVTPHVHLGPVISFASRLRSWYSVVAQVCCCSTHRDHKTSQLCAVVRRF